MTATLKVRAGQYSHRGVKPTNEDSCGIRMPEGPLLTSKGIAAVIADGVSGCEAGREAAEVCVLGFLADYFSTPETWSVRKSGGKVLTALNHWLCGQGQRIYGSSRGLVSTVSILVVKSASAYLFHVGDTRIHRLRDGRMECLTTDHRSVLGPDRQYLSRALGADVHLAIDCRNLPVEPGDLFVLTTDGVHDYLSIQEMTALLNRGSGDPEMLVRELVSGAMKNGSRDNLTCQMIRIDRLPVQDKEDLYGVLTELPFPPPLEPGMVLDGYRILRELHASNRTQIYLALEGQTGREVVLKTPSSNFEDDPEYIERFLHEEWAGRRLDSPHVLKVLEPAGRRSCLYCVTEYVEGRTLRQWMRDHPTPPLSMVRDIVDQIATGLRAFHRMEMIHQDLKPENVLIDRHGTVKIIDFGSSKIAGIEEISVPWERNGLLGTKNYTAPEILRGAPGTEQSDLYSLGVLTYEMLTGRLPYGPDPSFRKANRVPYLPAARFHPELPAWMDGAIRKAVQRDPKNRYTVISELTHELSHPNPSLIGTDPVPLLEKDPVAFWRGLAVLLLIVSMGLLYFLVR
jgi:serine/threonine protein phosphatase PrpC